MIKRRIFSPKAQSLRHVPEGKKTPIISVGIMEPGKHDFGTVSRGEEIRVTSGVIRINGCPYIPERKNYCLIKPGTRVIFETDVVSSYICFFSNETE